MYNSYADVLESYIIDDIATEGIGDVIKKAGKAIVETIKKLIEKIKNLIMKIKGGKSKDSQSKSEEVSDSSKYDKEIQMKFNKAVNTISKLNSLMLKITSGVKDGKDEPVPEDGISTIGRICNELRSIYDEIDALSAKGGRIDQEAATRYINSLSVNMTFLQRLIPIVDNSENTSLTKLISSCIAQNNNLCSKIEYNLK